jgi:hypothetical protein
MPKHEPDGSCNQREPSEGETEEPSLARHNPSGHLNAFHELIWINERNFVSGGEYASVGLGH